MRKIPILENNNYESFMFFLYFAAVIMISFDLFLVFNIFGFSVRLSLLILLFPMIYIFVRLSSLRTFSLPIAFKHLLIWTAFILVFIPHTTFLFRNIGYAIWLCFYVILIFTTVQLFRKKSKVRRLLYIYVLSFLLVSIFGLIQFIIGIMGLDAPLVVQWWPNGIPRINGFSYEPSYYATYLMTGWVFVSYLFEKKSEIISHRLIRLTLIMSTVALLLSSSRMGFIIMVLWLLRYLYLYLQSIKRTKFTKKHAKVLLTVLLTVVLICAIVVLFIGIQNLRFLIEGLGIGGTKAHSSSTRISFMLYTLQTFIESPIIGYSLGGIAPAIGQLFGDIVTSQNEAADYEGMNIIAEVLAASGIVGFYFFVRFLFELFFRPFKLSMETATSVEDKHVLIGLLYSFLFLLIILQFNQNILRPYVWLHIAILAAYYQTCKDALNEKRDFHENSY